MNLSPLSIVLAVVVLGTGSALAVMNNACRNSHHAWLRFTFRHPAPHTDWTQLNKAKEAMAGLVAIKSARQAA